MRTLQPFAVVTMAALLAACASRPTPVPVISPQSEVSALVGEWTGEYNSPETGRSGSIAFTLVSGKDTAVGNVMMVPRAPNETIVSTSAANQPIVKTNLARGAGEMLTIRFVRLEGNQVMGTLDPYRDPDCGCQLSTTFRGAFKDARTIEGTFNSLGSEMGHIPTSGRWKVTRSAP